MWQRFTKQARQVILYAQEEAHRFESASVSTEHLLLGLVRDEDALGSRVIKMHRVSLEQVRIETETLMPKYGDRPNPDLTLTPRAKRVIDLAFDEAIGLLNNCVGTEHLLLGLIREGQGTAGRVFAKLGIALNPVRETVRQLQGQGET